MARAYQWAALIALIESAVAAFVYTLARGVL